MKVSYIQQALLQVGLALWHPLAVRPWEVPEAITPLASLTTLLPVQDTTRKAPPRESFSPNQINLLELVSAVRNLLRALGVQ